MEYVWDDVTAATSEDEMCPIQISKMTCFKDNLTNNPTNKQANPPPRKREAPDCGITEATSWSLQETHVGASHLRFYADSNTTAKC